MFGKVFILVLLEHHLSLCFCFPFGIYSRSFIVPIADAYGFSPFPYYLLS